MYIAPKVGTITVALLRRQFRDACALQREVMRMPSYGATRQKNMASDNVFRVGASFRTFSEMQNALHTFEQQTHNQFYMRDPESRTRDPDSRTGESCQRPGESCQRPRVSCQRPRVSHHRLVIWHQLNCHLA